MALGLLASPAQAAFPGKNGLIAFERSVRAETYVYTARPDGSGARRLSCSRRDPAGKCFDREPAWDRTGTRLAVANSDGIAVVDRSGKLIKQVATHGPPSDEPLLDSTFGEPAWSPNSKALAYADRAGDDTEVYIVEIETGKTRKLTHGPAEPAWSVSNRIALSGFYLWTVWPDGKVPRVVFNGEVVGLDWSPGGRQLLFTNGERLFTSRSSGRGRRRLRIGRRVEPSDPKWSPNGKVVIWVSVRRGKPRVQALNRRTGRVRTLIHNALSPDWQPRPRSGAHTDDVIKP